MVLAQQEAIPRINGPESSAHRRHNEKGAFGLMASILLMLN